jgi:hypothetical protein
MLSELNPLIQSAEIVELYKAIAEVQKKYIAFLADTVNPHFKNKFSSYPDMLQSFSDWNKAGEFGLVFSCKPFLKGVKCTLIHTPSGQFETWYAMIPPDLTKDINAWKGANTSMGRLQLAGSLGMGSDPDVDNSDLTMPEVKPDYKLDNNQDGQGDWLNLLKKDGNVNKDVWETIKTAPSVEAVNKRFKLNNNDARYIYQNLKK